MQVRVGAGAGAVTLDGTTHNGVAAGSVFASTGWQQATDRYDVDASGGVSALVVDRR